jgi:RNA polymerase sigma-70 factor, ECF subfamily
VDRELVERARHGDREAYELLARASARRLYGVAYRILRDSDRAQDATQQALLSIWLDLPQLREPDRFEAWTYRLVTRASVAEARRERGHRAAVRVGPELDLPVPDEAGSIELRDILDRAFETLSPEHRAVVVLHHYAGLPLTEIADIVGVPYGTVGSRLHHAHRRLRSALEAERPATAGGPVA